jgi:hypothetical protein
MNPRRDLATQDYPLPSQLAPRACERPSCHGRGGKTDVRDIVVAHPRR